MLSRLFRWRRWRWHGGDGTGRHFFCHHFYHALDLDLGVAAGDFCELNALRQFKGLAVEFLLLIPEIVDLERLIARMGSGTRAFSTAKTFGLISMIAE